MDLLVQIDLLSRTFVNIFRKIGSLSGKSWPWQKKCFRFLSKHRQTTDQFKCGQTVNKILKFRIRKQGPAVSVAYLLHLLNKYCKMYLNQWWANVWNVVLFWDLCSERWQCWWRRIVCDTLIVRSRWAKKRKKNNFALNYLIELIALNLLFTKNLIIQWQWKI